jgi:hypothetical protein
MWTRVPEQAENASPASLLVGCCMDGSGERKWPSANEISRPRRPDGVEAVEPVDVWSKLPNSGLRLAGAVAGRPEPGVLADTVPLYTYGGAMSTAMLATRGKRRRKEREEIPDAANQLHTLRWSNLNKILLQFSEDVSAEQGDLVLVGVRVRSYAFSDFSYETVAHRATWILRQSLSTDKLLLDLDGSTAGAVVDTAANVPGLD